MFIMALYLILNAFIFKHATSIYILFTKDSIKCFHEEFFKSTVNKNNNKDNFSKI